MKKISLFLLIFILSIILTFNFVVGEPTCGNGICEPEETEGPPGCTDCNWCLQDCSTPTQTDDINISTQIGTRNNTPTLYSDDGIGVVEKYNTFLIWLIIILVIIGIIAYYFYNKVKKK